MNTIAAATSYGLFLVTIYNQSQLAERKNVARYWSINTAVTAVPLIVHPSPIELLIQFDIPASIKLTLVIWTKLAAAVQPCTTPQRWGCTGERFCQSSTAPVGGKGRFWCAALRHNAYVRIILSDFVRFWCIFCMVFFTRRVRIAGGRFWCAVCNSVNRSCSTSTLLLIVKKFSQLNTGNNNNIKIAFYCKEDHPWM